MCIRDSGLIAIALLVLSAISIIPPIDAFTVSKNNQIGFLERKLIENDMLVDNAIVPKSDVPLGDKIVITKVVSYIDNMGYNKEVAYLPSDFKPERRQDQALLAHATPPAPGAVPVSEAT